MLFKTLKLSSPDVLLRAEQECVKSSDTDYISVLYYCRTCFSMGDLGVQVFIRLSVRLSVHQHLPWASFEHNSSYSFVPIFLKLCRCFHHGMRICMWFGYNC